MDETNIALSVLSPNIDVGKTLDVGVIGFNVGVFGIGVGVGVFVGVGVGVEVGVSVGVGVEVGIAIETITALLLASEDVYPPPLV